VLPLDAVMLRGGRAEATAMVAIGEGVLSAGDDAAPRTPLRRAGERLRTLDVAAIAAAGIDDVVVREPRIGLARASGVNTPPIGAAYALLARAIAADGAALIEAPGLEAALADQRADAVIAIGGTGNGRNDTSVRILAELGRVDAHGIAIAPGETAAFGFVGERPVLLVPGRLDSALTVWLLIGRYLVAKLAGGDIKDLPALIPLKRKVTSTIGLTELVPVRLAGGMAEPLGSGYLSITMLTRSDGWIVVAAESEGFAAGAQVAVRPWP
jgi:molybdopterin biosynthesis enzyme